MKWLEEFGKGFINLGNILVGVVALKSLFERSFNISSLVAIMAGIIFYIIGILSIKRSENDNE